MNKFFITFLFLLFCPFCSAMLIQDDVAKNIDFIEDFQKPYTNYNFESTVKIPIKLKIVDPIKSEDELYEGQIIDFKVAKDVLYNNKIILKRGTRVPAKVSVIITPGMNGIPASVIFSGFKIDGFSDNKLTDSYEIFGQDRSLLVFPLKWALTPIPPTGSLTNFIKGGHAKLKTKKAITIYYYPEWI